MLARLCPLLQQVRPRAVVTKRHLKSLKLPETGTLPRDSVTGRLSPWAANWDGDVGFARWTRDFDAAGSKKTTLNRFAESLFDGRTCLCCCERHFGNIGVADSAQDDATKQDRKSNKDQQVSFPVTAQQALF